MRYVLQRFVRFVAVFVVVTFLVMVFLADGHRRSRPHHVGRSGIRRADRRDHREVPARQNYVVQYVTWLKNLVTGDLGRSEIFSTDVTELLQSKIMPTLLDRHLRRSSSPC